MAHDVFISYASSDRAVANAVCSQLESIHRVRCWIAPRDITPGASWAESIIDALDTAKIMVLIFSSSANASMQIEREVERAVHKGIHIIPLRIEDATPTKTLEYFISAPHWLDALSTPMEEHIDKLAISVKALLAKGARLTPSAGIETHELPAVAASAPPAAAPRKAASAAPAAKNERSWAFSALAGAAVAGLVAVIAYQFMVPRAPQSSATQTPAAPATASAPAAAPPPQAPAAEPSSSAAAQPASPAPPSAAVTPASATAASRAAGAAAPTTAPPAVDPKASAAATGKPNLFIDFRNPIDEGSIAVSIDGQQRWSASLAPPPADASGKRGRAPEVLTRALSVPPGDHKVEIQLLHADGRSRERRDLSMRLEPAQPRTMRIRLSRFKRDLQVAMVAGALPATDAEDAKAAQAKETPTKAAQAKAPATAKPAATAPSPAAKAQVAKEK